ncbi:MAG: ATP-binding protein [Gammaproteobacteria bacterium]|nr:ATP-binding protein [Gammaproteobacteria bacterium]
MPSGSTSQTLSFRPRARLLQLLGDELIGSPRLAVFELVKNAYDADAKTVTVLMDGLGGPSASIVVRDDGVGMTLSTIRDIWLVPAHDHRERQRTAGVRTAKNRLPLGEKGLGRFAAHKLGDKITLVTRAIDSPECTLSIDWTDLVRHNELSDATVTVRERTPRVFVGDSTGTRLTISNLRQSWPRGEVRRLQRQITSISSPFHRSSDDFRARLLVPDHLEWLEDLPDTVDLLHRAPWHFRFSFHNGQFRWQYKFRRIPAIKVQPRSAQSTNASLLVRPADLEDDDTRRRRRAVVADASISDGIGPVTGDLYVFDRDKEVLARQGEGRLIETFLDQNGGVRVYRDGIRVYNYGEVGDDWLGLDLSRVNAPTVRISRNIVVGAIDLSLENSPLLREKTNREGFVENSAFRRFRAIVRGALTPLIAERKVDKDKIRVLTAPSRSPEAGSIIKPLGQLRRIARRHGLHSEFEPIIARIERHYQDFRDTMVRAGTTTIGITLVFHEVEQGVRSLCQMIEAQNTNPSLRRRARDLAALLSAFADLARRGERKTNSLNLLVRRALEINRLRLNKHGIQLEAPCLADAASDIHADFVFGTVLGALNNLIDNAIYWLQVRWPADQTPPSRRLYISVNSTLSDGPAIVVADNGPGLSDEPSVITQPFFTRRPEGMGLGLYYANIVMELGNGALAFPTAEEAEVPDAFDGAIVALVFPPAGGRAKAST